MISSSRVSTAGRRRAFTLVEMVVALTIMAILLSLAFPAMKALKDHEEATHVTKLVDLANFLRARAVSERRPYQIVFDQGTIYGLRYFYPYKEATTFQEFLLKQDEERERRKAEIKRMEVQRMQMAIDGPEGTDEAEPAPLPNIDDEYFVRQISLPKEMLVEVRPWGDLIWLPVDGTRIQRWVFQPTGLCDPLQVRFGNLGEWQELTFEVLTGDLGSQRFYRTR